MDITYSKYDQVNNFYNGVATVIKDNRYGVILIGGLEVIPPIYDYISPFENGFATALKNGYCVHIDLSGREYVKSNDRYIPIPSGYDEVRNYYDGIACFRIKDKWGAIDLDGKVIFEAQFYYLSDFTKGTAKFIRERTNYTNCWGFLNTSGFISESNYMEPNINEDGTIFVDKDVINCKNGSWDGTINRQNTHLTNDNKVIVCNGSDQVILDSKYYFGRNYHNNIACVQGQSGLWGCVDLFGKEIFSVKFNDIQDFEGGFTIGVLNKELHLLSSIGTDLELPKNLKRCRIFHGVLLASENETVNWGKESCYILSTSGRIILGPIDVNFARYDKASNSIILSNLDDEKPSYIVNILTHTASELKKETEPARTINCKKVGKCLIDEHGHPYVVYNNETIFLPDWCKGGELIEDSCIIGENNEGKLGVISLGGETLCLPIFENIVKFENGIVYGSIQDGFYRSQEKKLYGIYDTIFNTLISPAFKELPYRIGLCYAVNDYGITLYDLNGKKITRKDEYYSSLEIISYIYILAKERFRDEFKLLNICGLPVVDEWSDEIVILKEGLFKGRHNTTWSLYNEQGKVCNTKFNSIEYNPNSDTIFVNRKCFVSSASEKATMFERVESRAGELDVNGNIIVRLDNGIATNLPSKFSWGEAFENGIAHVWTNSGNLNVINPQFDIVLKQGNNIVKTEVSVDDINQIPGSSYFIYTKNSLKGIMNRMGCFTTLAKYSSILHIGNDLFIISINNKFGVIDAYGDIIIPCKYDEITGFSGKLEVCSPYLSSDYVIKQTLENISFEILTLRIYNRCGLTCNNGERLVPPKYKAIALHDNGYIIKEDKYGFIDKDLNVIIPTIYDNLYLSGDVFLAIQSHKKGYWDSSSQSSYSIIDLNGRIVVNTGIYQSIRIATNGLFWVTNNNKYGIIDARGKVLITPQFDKIEEFKNGVALVSYGEWEEWEEDERPYTKHVDYINDKWGAVNELGELIIPIKYRKIEIIEENDLLKVTSYFDLPKGYSYNHKDYIWGLENPDQSYFFNQLDHFQYFDKTGKLLLINEDGSKCFVERRFDWQSGLDQNGYSIVMNDGKFCHADANGKLIVFVNNEESKKPIALNDKFSWGYDSFDKYIIVEQDNKKGIIDLNGNTIVPCEFDLLSIDHFQKNGNIYFICGNKDKSPNWIYYSNRYIQQLRNERGEIIIDNFINVKYLGFNLFAITNREGKVLLYNDSGYRITDLEFEYISSFGGEQYNNNLTKVPNCQYAIAQVNNETGVINQYGEIVIPFKSNQSIEIISNRIFKINGRYYDDKNNLGSLLNGKFITIPAEYESGVLIDDNCMIVTKNNLCGCIDPQTGKIIIPIEYDEIKYDQRLFFAYQTIDNQYYASILNTNGEKIITPIAEICNLKRYDDIILFQEFNGKLGAYSVSGKLICNPSYDKIEIFSKELIKVGNKVSGYYHTVTKWGLINYNGEIIVPVENDSIELDKSDLFIRMNSEYNGKRFARLDGSIIECKYSEISAFEDGLAIVKDSYSGCFGVIDTNMKEVIACIHESLEYDREHQRFRTRYGEISLDGRFIIGNDSQTLLLDKRYTYGSKFINDLSVVQAGTSYRKQYGLVKSDGSIIYSPIFSSLERISSSTFKFKYNDRYGICDETGHILLENMYVKIKRVSKTMARTSSIPEHKNNTDIKPLYGLVLLSGELLLEPEFDYIGKPVEGYCVVSKNSKWGLYNLKDRILSYFDNINFLGIVSNGLCRFNHGGTVDIKETQYYTPGWNNSMEPHGDKVIEVKVDSGKWGFMNISGQITIPEQYDKASNFREGLAAVKLNGKYGFINKSNEIIVPFEYDSVEYSFKNGKGALIKAGTIFVFDINGKICDSYSEESEGDYSDYDDSPTYDKYGGPDGYSDQAIDDAFDGDPSNLWNID